MATEKPRRVFGPGQESRRNLIKTALAGAAMSATALPGLAQAAETGQFPFADHPKWRFVFVNHVTTNPFFVPTQYGIEDACKLLGCTYQWTGSQNSIATEMVNSMNAAIASHADAIAVCLVDPHAFNDPTDRALQAGIPVFSYNADVTGNHRLAYIGQDLYNAGMALGERIVSLVDSGEVAGFIATPGQLNIQPRLDGARDAIKKSGKKITLHEVSSGAKVNEEFSAVEAFYLGHPNLKGMFAVDAGSTEAVGATMRKHGLAKKGVKAGGFDMLPGTLKEIHEGNLDFTIDQQPYLQGFYTVLEMFLYMMSGGLTGPSEINTGLKFVTASSVGPYLNTTSRFEGNSQDQKLIARKGPIGAV